MSALSKIQERIKRKGLRNTLTRAVNRHLFYHWELLWMERDLVSPVPPHRLRPYPPLQMQRISVNNVGAFSTYFGDRVDTMRELAADGHTGVMYLDGAGDCVAFIWGSLHDYHDRHYYGCRFPVQPGQFFEFGGELMRQYWGSKLSVDLQLELWKAMAPQGCDTVVDVCESHNIPALKLHLRMGYQEQGRITHVYCLFGRWKFFRQSRYSGSRLQALRKEAPAPTSSEAA